MQGFITCLNIFSWCRVLLPVWKYLAGAGLLNVTKTESSIVSWISFTISYLVSIKVNPDKKFMWLSMQKCWCSIHNGTLSDPLSDPLSDQIWIVYQYNNFKTFLFFNCGVFTKETRHFYNRKNTGFFNLEIRQFLPYYWSD